MIKSKKSLKEQYKYWSELKIKSMKKSLQKKNQSSLDQFYIKCYESNHICEETGQDLDKVYASGAHIFQGNKLKFIRACCAHILPKSKFPKFKEDVRNIMMLRPDVHAIIDFGTISQKMKLSCYVKFNEIKQKLENE